jgi:hypothetical protein
MPPGFSYPEKIDLWLPLSFLPEELRTEATITSSLSGV